MAHRLANAAVIGAAIGLSVLAVQQFTHALPGSPKTFTSERERCYGVVRAGRNDCGTSKHACAGQARRDRDAEEWLMLPAGTCERLAGGRLKAGAA
ncbi:DUF2282 domain-containing protein [Aromatoleum anaerobium]|uniref:DUF2282 domain-containing protein n=1 Tax=Aromatoleum anaerobium TaxID=182180 RepID=A0ABX1PLY5_9RHOO|nr:DUF2282 domain-containing protein [Aromatoleum anaerobium]MCK0509447.1 DUF2282 domain-containing protein [Aromatoleum anaerobium]